MGRETKTFRQTNKAGRADHSTQTYAKINRQGGWGKTINVFKIKKGEKI